MAPIRIPLLLLLSTSIQAQTVTSDASTTAPTLNAYWNASASATPAPTPNEVLTTDYRVVVTDQAMGARCAVAADFDGDGRLDIVSASSNDNAVSWFRNEGFDDQGLPQFSIKKVVTWNSLGSRIVTVADIDGDGDIDVVGASYYDSSLRWFENDGNGEFTPHLISEAVNEGQGVTVADVDNDGDADIISASSGDNTIAVFKNINKGQFCEVKEVVDDNAVGARTVVAADLNGDGWIDLASASKDDDTVAWYPNDGTGHFPTKIIISAGNDTKGAYSLVAADIDQDGHQDLVVASNGNDRVTLWRNDGTANFDKTVIFDNADFVLSVTAVDFDGDGDIDVASASFFDGHINWYENVDGKGYEWKNHTIYVGVQGHYVSHGDMDGDGDDDLIAVTHAENTVAVFLAQTKCDEGANHTQHKQECCHTGTEWNGTQCQPCRNGTYGILHGVDATCTPCPTDACTIPGFNVLPTTCSAFMSSSCGDIEASIAECVCEEDTMKDPTTDACTVCPDGQVRPDSGVPRTIDTLANYSLWEEQQGSCYVPKQADYTVLIVILSVVGALVLLVAVFLFRKRSEQAKEDALWTISKKEIQYDDPIQVLGRGAFGEVLRGYYRGTTVAIKKTIPKEGGSRDSVIRLGASNGMDVSASSATGGMGTSGDIGAKSMTVSSLGKSPMGQTKDRRMNFVQEMRTLSKIRHPCITTVMGAVLDGDSPLLVMEYMENGALRSLLGNPSFPLDPEQTLPLLRDIMNGMRFLHAAQPPVVHGDLKCANVLVDSNFRAKIADFGLSGKKAVGTPTHMAPELLRGEMNTTASDVYAFGVLLWEIMTHKVPYEGLDIGPSEIIERIKAGTLRPDCEHDGLDEELVACMQECWAQDPESRPSLEDLEMKLIPLCGQSLFSVMQEKNKFAVKQSTLLQDVFPEHIAKVLLSGGKVEPEHHDCVSVYFSDIVGFTTISSTLEAAEVSDLLDRLYIAFDKLAEKHGVFKLETIGDAWVGVTNLTQPQKDHAARLARFSLDAMHAAQKTPIHLKKPEMGNVKIRVGFHSGPVVSNVVGTRNPRFCLFGDTMNTASRMESTSKELRIQCSGKSAKLAKEQDKSLKLDYRGKIKVKGKGRMRVFWLNEGRASCDDHDFFADECYETDLINEQSEMFANEDISHVFKKDESSAFLLDDDEEKGMAPEQAPEEAGPMTKLINSSNKWLRLEDEIQDVFTDEISV